MAGIPPPSAHSQGCTLFQAARAPPPAPMGVRGQEAGGGWALEPGKEGLQPHGAQAVPEGKVRRGFPVPPLGVPGLLRASWEAPAECMTVQWAGVPALL